MSTRTIREITALINEAKAELESVQELYERLQADLTAYERTLEALQERAEEEEEAAVPAKQLRNEMVKILQGAGEPMHYGEIYDRLRHRGVPVPGKEPRRNVGAHLSNDERFHKHGSGIWGLASWQEPATANQQLASEAQQRNVVSIDDRVREGERIRASRHNVEHGGSSAPADEHKDPISVEDDIFSDVPF